MEQCFNGFVFNTGFAGGINGIKCNQQNRLGMAGCKPPVCCNDYRVVFGGIVISVEETSESIV